MSSLKVGTRDGQHREVVCGQCGGTNTRHTVRASATDTEEVEDEGVAVGVIETDYEIVECNGCGAVSFRSTWWTSNEDPDYFDLPAGRTQIFPPRLAGRVPLATFHLPKDIAAIYRETHDALSAGSQILAAIGMRAIVEAVCRRKKARGRDLEKRIDNLVERGFLAKKHAKVLHRLRDLGNQAAHRARSLDGRRLETALDVVEQLLKQIFVVDDATVRRDLPRKRRRRSS